MTQATHSHIARISTWPSLLNVKPDEMKNMWRGVPLYIFSNEYVYRTTWLSLTMRKRIPTIDSHFFWGRTKETMRENMLVDCMRYPWQWMLVKTTVSYGSHVYRLSPKSMQHINVLFVCRHRCPTYTPQFGVLRLLCRQFFSPSPVHQFSSDR